MSEAVIIESYSGQHMARDMSLQGDDNHLTIQDVARLAGVSRSTVSRVLTNHPRVSAEARDVVHRIIAETGYRPSHVARALVRGRSSLVGVVVPSISTAFYAELVRGIEKALGDEFTLAIVSTEDDEHLESRAFERLYAARVAGLIVSTFRHQSQDLFPKDIPVVFANRAPAEPRHSIVTYDNWRMGYLVTSLLLQQGHRNIGYLSASLDLPTSRQRREGYLQAMRDAGIDPSPAWSQTGGITMEFGLEAGRRLIEGKSEITGLFTDSDIVAIGVMEALWQVGLSVPRDLSVIACDDSPLAALTPVSLTAIRTPRTLVGEVAGGLIKEAIYTGQSMDARAVVLPVELVVRNSVAFPRRQSHLNRRSAH